MQMPDPTSDHQPKPSFRPCVGDIIARKLTSEKNTCAVVLEIYENVLGERVYRMQNVWRLLGLDRSYLVEQDVIDGLGHFPATRQDFQADYQEMLDWFLRRREEMYQAIRPFVEDTPSGEPLQPVTLEAAPQPWPLMMQYLNIQVGLDTQAGRNYRPCVGDILMMSVEPNKGRCAVVVNILEDAFGERVYQLLTTSGLTLLKGTEQLTQAQMDRTTYHPTTREAFHEALQESYAWFQSRLEELYQEVKPFVEGTGGTADEDK